MSTLKIIDVSKHNGSINWTSAAKQIDGVIIRAGYRGVGGGIATDPKFTSYVSGAIAAGIKRIGVYWWTTHTSSSQAKVEAEYVLKLLKPYKEHINFGVWLDSEKSNTPTAFNKLSASARTTCALAFLSVVEAGGYVAGVYASDSWYGTHLDMSRLAKYPFWVAKYSAISPKVVKKYVAWQYTSKAKCSGLSGNVDMSRFYEDISTMGKAAATPDPVATVEPKKAEAVSVPADTTNKEASRKPYIIGRTYTLCANLNVRTGAGATYAVKALNALTADGRRNAIPGLGKAVLKSGTKVTCKDVETLSNGAIWMKIPSGWICAKASTGKVYVK